MSVLQCAEDAPQCMTNHILDRYEAYLRTHVARKEAQVSHGNSTTTSASSVPTSLEEALAPLEAIYGKTFLSAVAIALHGAEPVIRYLEVTDMPTASAGIASGSEIPRLSSRRFYRVGDYVLYSPFYCPCSAYAYQSVRRQEVWCCKHMLALQIALRVESSGIAQDNLRERAVDADTFQSMLLESLVT